MTISFAGNKDKNIFHRKLGLFSNLIMIMREIEQGAVTCDKHDFQVHAYGL